MRHCLVVMLGFVMAGPAAAQSLPASGPAAATTTPVVTSPADAATPGAAAAQQRAVVRQVQAAPAAAPSVPTLAAPAGSTPQRARNVDGSITRGLLALQASGRAAGAARPVLGEAATRSWDRYLESFTQPVPHWFEEKVEISD